MVSTANATTDSANSEAETNEKHKTISRFGQWISEEDGHTATWVTFYAVVKNRKYGRNKVPRGQAFTDTVEELFKLKDWMRIFQNGTGVIKYIPPDSIHEFPLSGKYRFRYGTSSQIVDKKGNTREVIDLMEGAPDFAPPENTTIFCAIKKVVKEGVVSIECYYTQKSIAQLPPSIAGGSKTD